MSIKQCDDSSELKHVSAEYRLTVKSSRGEGTHQHPVGSDACGALYCEGYDILKAPQRLHIFVRGFTFRESVFDIRQLVPNALEDKATNAMFCHFQIQLMS